MIATSVDEVLNKTFDFVIVGGGTAGSVLAARLSEDPSVSVAVLEAGYNNATDPKIAIPAQYGRTFGDSQYDWGFATTEQKNANNRTVFWPRGFGLGGSSLMNFMSWTKPPKSDVDALEKLGNPGWNWENFIKYSKKAEIFHPPTKEQTDLFQYTYDTEALGTSGPVKVCYPHHAHTIDTLMRETYANLGVQHNLDPYNGYNIGSWVGVANVDPKTWTRSDAYTAYLLPAKDRKNLIILTGALVSRIIFSDDKSEGGVVATGVEFIHNEKNHKVNAGKEVILCGGSINSSQILELSGIGQPDVLSKIGVDVKVNLPGVGENLQEHVYFTVSNELDPSVKHMTFDSLRDPENAKEAMRLHAEGQGLMRTGITCYAFIPLTNMDTPTAPRVIQTIQKDIEDYQREPGIAPGLREQLDIQLATLQSDRSPDLEIVGFPGLFSMRYDASHERVFSSMVVFLNHPVSRGHIHVRTNNPRDRPEIDPHYFERESDLELLVEGLRYTRKLAQTEPLKSAIVGHKEVDPGPECQTDEEIRDFIKNTFSTTFHAAGTCSMLPREKQGVVDHNLKVYGTKNLRVVDLSIVPLHLSTHTQTVVYAIGEKAADIIQLAHRA